MMLRVFTSTDIFLVSGKGENQNILFISITFYCKTFVLASFEKVLESKTGKAVRTLARIFDIVWFYVNAPYQLACFDELNEYGR